MSSLDCGSFPVFSNQVLSFLISSSNEIYDCMFLVTSIRRNALSWIQHFFARLLIHMGAFSLGAESRGAFLSPSVRISLLFFVSNQCIIHNEPLYKRMEVSG